MLSSVTSTAVSSAAASTSAISMSVGIGLGVGGALIAILLIMLLSSKELLGASRMPSDKVMKSLNYMIIPLFFVFCLNVAFQVVSVL